MAIIETRGSMNRKDKVWGILPDRIIVGRHVADKTFDNILIKGSMTNGSFVRPIQTEKSKVHVIAVPSDDSKNIICFRNVSLPTE